VICVVPETPITVLTSEADKVYPDVLVDIPANGESFTFLAYISPVFSKTYVGVDSFS
jgi:hypothetical protein